MSLVTFLIAATVLAIAPGPGIAYVVARIVAGRLGVAPEGRTFDPGRERAVDWCCG